MMLSPYLVLVARAFYLKTLPWQFISGIFSPYIDMTFENTQKRLSLKNIFGINTMRPV